MHTSTHGVWSRDYRRAFDALHYPEEGGGGSWGAPICAPSLGGQIFQTFSCVTIVTYKIANPPQELKTLSISLRSSLLRCQIALHLRAWSNTFRAHTRIPTCTCTGTLITFDPTSPEILYPPLGPVTLAESVCAVLGRYKEWQNQWWR